MKLTTLAVIASTLATVAAPAFAQPTQEQPAARCDAATRIMTANSTRPSSSLIFPMHCNHSRKTCGPTTLP